MERESKQCSLHDVYGILIFRALVGAIILVAIWQLLTSGLGRGRSRNA